MLITECLLCLGPVFSVPGVRKLALQSAVPMANVVTRARVSITEDNFLPDVAGISRFKPILHTIRFVVYNSDPGVCDRINTRTNVMLQVSPSTINQKNVSSALIVIRQNDNRIGQIVLCR